MAAARLAGAALVVLLLGCGSGAGGPVGAASDAGGSGDVAKAPPTGPLTLSPVTWNQGNADLGRVQAVLEHEGTIAVFGSAGVLFFTGGVLVGSDPSATTWRTAAAIPAADGISTWMAGVDSEGRVRRVRVNAPAQDVTERYGLAPSKVLDLAGDAGLAAFLLEGGFAIGNGRTITRYDAQGQRAIATRGGKVALAVDRGLRIFEQGKETGVALLDASFVAYDASNNLVAAAPRGVYQLTNGSPQLVYDAGSRTIHQLVSAGQNVWFQVDGDLGLLSGGQVSLGVGGTLTPDARLVGSPSGDVWVMAGGQLSRLAARTATGDEATWLASVRPVHVAVCSNCHGASRSGKDSSNVDLSTYALWVAKKTSIYARVVQQADTQTAMPPGSAGFTLTADQKAAIEAWSKP